MNKKWKRKGLSLLLSLLLLLMTEITGCQPVEEYLNDAGITDIIEDYQTNEARLRLFAENIPFSLNKLDAVFNYDVDDKISYLVPLIKYHGDWINGNKLGEAYRWRT